MRKYVWLVAVLLTQFSLALPAYPAQSAPLQGHVTIKLWPQGVPGGSRHQGPEKETTRPSGKLVAGKQVIRLTDVSEPTITVFPPPKVNMEHSAVVVFPGGGYHILAMNLEGTEICRWLNSLGIYAFLVKYRVPSPPGVPRYQAPLQDAQRAVGYIRYHAKQWHLVRDKIGVIGFSAGGDIAALLSNNYQSRTYEAVGPADHESCRPDFAMLIYPAYLVSKTHEGYQLVPQLKVTANTPPTFLVQAENDPVHVENVIYYFLALKQANVTSEMHVFAHGGHGYGLRRTQLSITRWPALASRWLRRRGFLK